MHNLPNMARQVLESRIGIQLDDLAAKYYSKNFKDCTDSECYNCLLQMTKMLMETSDAIVGEKKLYYISSLFHLYIFFLEYYLTIVFLILNFLF